MTPGADSAPSADFAATAPERLFVVPLLVFLALLPPETRWESLLAVAVCSTLLVLVAWLGRGPRAGAGLVVTGALLALALLGTSASPGAGVQPTALFVLAAGLGLAASGRGLARSGPRAARALALLGGVVSLHAVYQALWGLELLASRIAPATTLPDHHALLERAAAGRAFANFSTPAALGGFLALTLPVTVFLANSERSRLRLAWWGLGALQLAGLLATASATATAALIGALLLAALCWGRNRLALGLAVSVLALVLVGVVAFRGGQLLSLTDANSPWRLRAGNFRSAAMMTLDHPWRGVGPGGFAENYSSYRRDGDNETRHVHNLPLEFAAELGLAGGVIGGALLLYLFLTPVVRARDDPDPVARGLALGLATFGLHNLADYTAFMPSMLLTAVLVRGILSARREGAVHALGESPRWTALAACAVVVASAVVLGAGGLADDARVRARAAAFAGAGDEAETLARRATLLAPWDPGAAIFLARATARDLTVAPPDRARRALDLADRAVRLSPVSAAARETRALARLSVLDYPGAYADLLEAARLHPLEPRYAESRDRLRERLVVRP